MILGMEINECGKTGGASCRRNWCEMGPTGNGDIWPACHRFFGFLIRYSDRTSRSLSGASRPFEQAFELVGRIHAPRNQTPARSAGRRPAATNGQPNTRQRLSTSVRQRGGNGVDIILLRAAGRLCRAANITCKQSINLLRYVMNLVLEYSSVTAVSLS